MKKWEYKEVECTASADVLNEFGNDGWELVIANTTGTYGRYALIFKREKVENPSRKLLRIPEEEILTRCSLATSCFHINCPHHSTHPFNHTCIEQTNQVFFNCAGSCNVYTEEKLNIDVSTMVICPLFLKKECLDSSCPHSRLHDKRQPCGGTCSNDEEGLHSCIHVTPEIGNKP